MATYVMEAANLKSEAIDAIWRLPWPKWLLEATCAWIPLQYQGRVFEVTDFKSSRGHLKAVLIDIGLGEH